MSERTTSRVLTLNGGSSSIRLAFYEVGTEQPHLADWLEGLDVSLSEIKNRDHSEVISAQASRVTVRLIRTDEELMIAKAVDRCLNPADSSPGIAAA